PRRRVQRARGARTRSRAAGWTWAKGSRWDAADARRGRGLCCAPSTLMSPLPEAAMNLSFLGPFHPQIVHTPVALLIFSAFFALIGRLTDRDWLKRASVLLLVFGFLGAFLAEQSG